MTAIIEITLNNETWSSVTYTDTLILQAKTGPVRIYIGMDASPDINTTCIILQPGEEWDLTEKLSVSTYVKALTTGVPASLLVVA